MKAIDFVVRDGAGAIQRGVVPQDGNTSVALKSGQEISFNLRQIDLIGQQRIGDDLIMTLADGRTITLENYFNDVGEANRLFISADGYLNEVAFVEATDGELFAQYGPTEQWGKWSPSDDLIYLGRTEVANLGPAAGDEEVSMLGAAILGPNLLGLGAGAAAVGGVVAVVTDDDDDGPAQPTVDGTGTTTNVGGDDDTTHTFTVTGTGQPGDTVDVEANGETIQTTIAEDGTWSVTFEGDSFPTDGSFDTTATFTHEDGTTTVLTGPSFVIDTVGPDVGFSTGVESVGHVVNEAEHDGGVTLTGTGEVGATLEITIEGVTQTVVVDDTGAWSASWAEDDLATGDYSTAVTIVATDAFGNTTTVSDMLVVDTITEVTIDTAGVEIDGIINADEAADGVTLTGTAEAGASVEVTFNGVTQTVTAEADGTWTADYDAADVPAGETDVAVTAVATDTAGNTSTATGTVVVDTVTSVTMDTSIVAGDGTISAAEAAGGITITGTAQADATVEVTFNGTAYTATVASDGSWSVDIGSDGIPTGELDVDVTAVATDAAGNTATATGTVVVDTVANVTIDTDAVEGDGTINAAEAADGVTLTGTADAGASVDVTFNGVTKTVTAAADGTWSADYDAADIPTGETDVAVTAVATDALGNTATATGTVMVDTVTEITMDTSALGTVNADAAAGGLTLTGTAEVGASVEVTFNGTAHTATVASDGTWSVDIPSADIPAGEMDVDVTAVATDAAGNTASTAGTVSVDTGTEITIDSGVEGDDVINAAEAADGVTLTGTTQPGSTVEVTFNGITQTATVAADGTWTVDYAATAIPAGETAATITAVATDASGNTATATSTVDIDTVADVTIDGGVEGDGVINAAEAADGVTLTGTAQPGSSVEVTFNGITQTAAVAADGSWSVDYAASAIPAGETQATITAVATDAAGNSATATSTVDIDTVTDVTIHANIEGDGTISATEAADGVTLTGTAQPGSTVEVTFNGITQPAIVDAAGNWSVAYAASAIPTGETQATITAVATDAAGNSATTTSTVNIDTGTDVTVETATVEGDGTVNAVEASDGVVLTGTAQPGASVQVTFNGVTQAAVVDAAGNWSTTYAASDIPSGETQATVTAVATDAAGNTATATGTVEIDTLVNALGFTSTPGGSDAVINADEAGTGLSVTGVVEPGSTVVVQLGAATTTAVVAPDGTWTATFGIGSVPPGTYVTDMVATATDPAGNTSSVTQSVGVDTEASVLTIDGPIEGDDVINEVEASDGVVLSGTADPGALVSVTMQGVTHQAVADGNGVWQAYFNAGEIAPGTYDAQITATTTDAAGNVSTVNDTVHVDTNVDNLSIAADVIEGDNVISEIEHSDGVVVTGTTEPGSTVLVTLGGVTVPGIVDAAGNWHAPFSPDQIPVGEYTTDVTVTATDQAGNVASVTDTVEVDTLVNPLTLNDPGTADGVINNAEAQSGINLSGVVEPGSTVMVDFNSFVLEATVDPSGNWTLDIPSSAIPNGTYNAPITVMATDPVGNTDTISDVVSIDTEAPEGPVIASFTRDGDGIRGISTELSDGDLTVSQVHADGSITNVAATQTDINLLGETNFQFQSNVPDGSHLIVTAEDAAGNASGTYVVLDDEAANTTVDLSNPALGNYQIEAVELQFAEEANLTITEAQLVNLSDASNTLTIHGGSDDTVTISGATMTGSTIVDGQTYDVYSLGTEGTVILDDDITVNTAIA
ncbi:MAG: Ig-like domain-containing protein [Pseudomonadota bacterium]